MSVVNSRNVSGVSAAVLFGVGLGLLFAPSTVLALVGAVSSASTSWVGQLVGAGCLAVASLDWLSRSAVLGGIYGRPVVFANLQLFFVGALVLLDAALDRDGATGLWLAATSAGAFAFVYGWLLLRGPLASDFPGEEERRTRTES